MTKQIQKSIRFPAKAVEIIDNQMQATLGIGFNEYIKIYVVNKAEEIQGRSHWTPELRAEIEEAKKEVREGKRPLLKSAKEVKEYFNKLLNEDE